MKKGDLICASYNIVDGTGGFVRVESAFREDFQPSLANSRTGVHCIASIIVKLREIGGLVAVSTSCMAQPTCIRSSMITD